MTFKRYLGQFFILMLLTAQLALAQHATVHFLEDQYAVSHEHHADHSQPSKDKICQVCLFAKGFAHSDLVAGNDVPSIDALTLSVVPDLQGTRNGHDVLPYEARGPPSVFLS